MKHLMLASAAALSLAAPAFAATDVTALDLDKDGMVSFAEVTATNPTISQSEFDEVDANDNNQWDANELLTSMAQGVLSRGESVAREAVDMTMDKAMLDANKDDIVDMAEVTMANASVSQSEFDEIDLNDNNRWDNEEINTSTAQGYLKRGQPDVAMVIPEYMDKTVLDTDGNDEVTMEEVAAVNATITQYEFDEIDTNDNNRWDNEEINTSTAQGYLKRS